MSWRAEDRERRKPEVHRGWLIVGAMVKRRREQLGWSQRDLERASGRASDRISRLENGRLSGIRFSRFARLVEAMNGIDLDAPRPARVPMQRWS